jgi:hypothetical protein
MEPNSEKAVRANQKIAFKGIIIGSIALVAGIAILLMFVDFIATGFFSSMLITFGSIYLYIHLKIYALNNRIKKRGYVIKDE